jgi:hypothetical protein
MMKCVDNLRGVSLQLLGAVFVFVFFACKQAVANTPTASVVNSRHIINLGDFDGLKQTHYQVSRLTVSLDGTPVILSRYERRDGRNRGLEGEHFSTLTTTDGQLKGFANISLDLVGKTLPSAKVSEQIAINFLRQTAPDLLADMQISSISEYSYPMRITRAGRLQRIELKGMWVKARNRRDGRWFWVIVDAQQKPMIFERDVQWSHLLFRRSTEQWLSDPWLKANLANTKHATH